MSPGDDRLAIPVLPESPTQVDIGRNLYYYHCMPCHGDRGQGLTDEWREVWVEDHQDCWARGCHAARSELDGFYIPRTIPAVIGSPPALAAFQDAEELFAFLRATQPPQRPGALADAEYWALTNFLFHENGRPLPLSPGMASVSSAGLVLALLAPLLALASVTWLARREAETEL
jgi:cytochrome c